MHRVLAALGDDGEVGGNGELALDDGAVRAGLLVDQIDAVVGHRGDEQPAARIEGQVVEPGLHRGDQLLGLAGQADAPHAAGAGVDDIDVVAVLRVDVGGGRDLEALGDHLDRAGLEVDLDDLALEPQRAVEEAVVLVDLEAVQAAHLLGDAPELGARERLEVGLVDVLEVDLVERVAQEDLRHEQPAVLAEGQRIGPAHAIGDLDGLAVGLADIDLAQQEGRPRHGAVVGEGDVVGHAHRRVDDAVDLARIDLHAIDRLTDHGACEELVVLVEGQAVHAVEPRARHQELLVVFLRRRGLGRRGLLRQCAARHGHRERQRREKPAQLHPVSSKPSAARTLDRAIHFVTPNPSATIAATTRIPQEGSHGRSAFGTDDRRAGRHRPRSDVLDDAGRHGRRRDPRRPHQEPRHGSPGRSEIRRAQQEPPLGLGRPAEEGGRRRRAAPDREGRRPHRAVPPRRRRTAGPGAGRLPRAAIRSWSMAA